MTFHLVKVEKSNRYLVKTVDDMVAGKRKGEVFLVDDPYQCALDVIEKCKPYTISHLKCKESDLHSFIHPISGCVIEDGLDYEKRLILIIKKLTVITLPLKINCLLKWHPNTKKFSSESCTRNQRTPKNTWNC